MTENAERAVESRFSSRGSGAIHVPLEFQIGKGVLAGFTALVTAPEFRAEIAGIEVGSAMKGLVAGLITGAMVGYGTVRFGRRAGSHPED